MAQHFGFARNYMTDSNKRPIFNLYIDDSGTRHPNHAKPTSSAGDWFALGGVIVAEEDEHHARLLHQEFCDKWEITYPLHSVKIRHRADNFSWIASLAPPRSREFFKDLDNLMVSIPVVGHACVIDRPGYHNRYFERYGRQRWHLCKTAFTVLCERAAKFAMKHDRRVRVFVEETDPDADKRIRQYFREMRGDGMPFSKDTSEKYGPLSAEELKFRLLDQSFKRKTSAMIQLADLYLYPLCRSGYDNLYRPLKLLKSHSKIVDHVVDPEEVKHLGLKYSCFD